MAPAALLAALAACADLPRHPPPPPPVRVPTPKPPPRTVEVLPPTGPTPGQPAPTPPPEVEEPAPIPAPGPGEEPLPPPTTLNGVAEYLGDAPLSMRLDPGVTFMLPSQSFIGQPAMIYAEEGTGMVFTLMIDPGDRDREPVYQTERYELFRYSSIANRNRGVQTITQIARDLNIPIPTTIIFSDYWLLLGRSTSPQLSTLVEGRFRGLFP